MFKKHIRPIALILSVIMIISIISVSTGGFGLLNAKAEQTEADDIKIAQDISNLTGIDVNMILDIKRKGLSWNEVLEEAESIKNSNGNNRTDRDNILITQNLDGDLVEQLKNEGFSDEEIIEARLLAERVQFQLNEIVNNGRYSASVMPDSTGDDFSIYEDLAEKIDIAVCLPFLLRLKSEFGTIEKVMDEYLTSLQLDVDFSLYLKDKDEYLREKSLLSAGKALITVQRIEEKLLLCLQKENTENKGNDQTFDSIPADNKILNDESSFDLPVVPAPEIHSVIPENPADALMNEINKINPVIND